MIDDGDPLQRGILTGVETRRSLRPASTVAPAALPRYLPSVAMRSRHQPSRCRSTSLCMEANGCRSPSFFDRSNALTRRLSIRPHAQQRNARVRHQPLSYADTSTVQDEPLASPTGCPPGSRVEASASPLLNGPGTFPRSDSARYRRFEAKPRSTAPRWGVVRG
jgi:hypothetical protein